jgi:Ca2+:H+ antiporter
LLFAPARNRLDCLAELSFKASIAGAIVTNTLFMLGTSFFLGGIKHHTQEYNRPALRSQTN